MKVIFFAGVLILAVLACVPSLWSRGRRPASGEIKPKFSGWVVYWDEANGQRALMQLGKALEEISIFAYHFDASGRLIPATSRVEHVPEWIKQNLKEPKPRLLVTIVNDVVISSTTVLKDAACVHEAIALPADRAAHIQQILALADGVDGVDIDYERINPTDTEAFSAFIKELGQALHAQKKWLSVVVQPSGGAIDWAAIQSSVDQIKIMAYLYHYGTTEPGSIAPTSWVSGLAESALKTIPADKLCIVLHTGGFDWPQKTPGRSIEYPQAAMLAKFHDQEIMLDKPTGSGHFQYLDQTISHEVWIEEAQGLKLKIQALEDLGIEHIAFWRLGTGDPALWENLVDSSSQASPQ